MKKLTSNVTLFLIFIFKFISGSSQEPLTTESRFSNLSRNPALAGIQVVDLKLSLCYHQQIKTILIPYHSLQFQIESKFKNKETEDGFTAAALIRYDEAGENNLKRAQFLPVLNFHKSLSEIKVSYLSMGFMAGIFKTQFDPFTLPSINNYNPIPFNPLNPVPKTLKANSSSYFDFSTGISLFTELNDQVSLNLGVALFHFSQNSLKHYENIPKMPREWVFNSGLFINKSNYTLQLFADIRINKNETKLYEAFILGIPVHQNLDYQKTEIQIGAYLNSNKEFSPVFSINSPGFLISISNNFLTSNQNRFPLLENAIETNLVLNINCHKRNNQSEKLRCFY
jgi:hypothetical protein